ncbi:hypothetical protein ACGFXB_22980 [Streptomyces canus]|uniref:hypothetical protein n=1 Tax=Streptomyces canus TaxID=58343 RepID=UPI003715DEC0
MTSMAQLRRESGDQLTERLSGIAATLRQVFHTARTNGTTPATAARELAGRRVLMGRRPEEA